MILVQENGEWRSLLKDYWRQFQKRLNSSITRESSYRLIMIITFSERWEPQLDELVQPLSMKTRDLWKIGSRRQFNNFSRILCSNYCWISRIIQDWHRIQEEEKCTIRWKYYYIGIIWITKFTKPFPVANIAEKHRAIRRVNFISRSSNHKAQLNVSNWKFPGLFRRKTLVTNSSLSLRIATASWRERLKRRKLPHQSPKKCSWMTG